MISRKDFLRNTFKSTAGIVTSKLDNEVVDKLSTLRDKIFPPGAVENFTEKCTSCGDCTSACPYKSIKMIYNGKFQKELPQIIPTQKACYMCEDTPCISSCKDEALLKSGDSFPAIGKAKILEKDCIAYNGSTCSVCYDACPLKRSAIKLKFTKPVIIDEVCTGCGICEEVCISNPKGVKVFP